jgi:hypothetical protein
MLSCWRSCHDRRGAGENSAAHAAGARYRAAHRRDEQPRGCLAFNNLPAIGQDQYLKRDDLGIIYHVNVVPTKHRRLIGATLIKEMFDRAAFGCRLFCCWCAQDIEANIFGNRWGFVPLAFRPIIFPGTPREAPRQIGPRNVRTIEKKRAIAPMDIASGGLRFVVTKPAPEPKPKPQRKPKVKNDPRLIAAARELRDRWLEHVNTADAEAAVLVGGKYDVSRQVPGGMVGTIAGASGVKAMGLLPAA